MRLKSKFFIFIFCFVSIIGLYASGSKERELSEDAKAYINSYYELRNKLFLYQDFMYQDSSLVVDLGAYGRLVSKDIQNRIDVLIEKNFSKDFNALNELVQKIEDRGERSFALSLGNYLLSQKEFELKGNKGNALSFLEASNSSVKEALRNGFMSAELFCLNGQIQNQFIVLKGGMNAIYYSTEARKNYQKALKLNNKHAHSTLLLGVWYMFAPDIAGGSIDKALSLLRKSRTLTEDSYIVFLSYVWESLALSSSMKTKESLEAIESALRIAPKNTWALWIQKETQEGKRPLDSMM